MSISNKLDLSTKKRELLDLLLQQEGMDAARPDAIPRRNHSGPSPLSFAQERLWFLDQLMPGSAFYNVPQALRFEGDLDLGLLADSLNRIVERHEVLRATFAIAGGKPVQVAAPRREVSVEVIDISHLPEADRQRQAQVLANQEAADPFDLSRGPLLRAKVVRMGAGLNVLLFTMHHIVSDAWSLEVLVKEVTELYGAKLEGREARLEELEIQYADYAEWQRGGLRGEEVDRQMRDWKG